VNGLRFRCLKVAGIPDREVGRVLEGFEVNERVYPEAVDQESFELADLRSEVSILEINSGLSSLHV
jgi:hypothetical protein